MIYLEPCSPEHTRREKPGELTAIQARRNGVLLCTYSHIRKWVSEERARKALAKDFPGETVIGVRERKSA